MRGLARSLGVSLGAVQHHFATKDALWKASTDDFSASLQRYASDAANPDLTSAIENLLEDARAFLMLLGMGIGSIAGSAEATHTLYGYDLNDPGDRSALAHALADFLSYGVLPR